MTTDHLLYGAERSSLHRMDERLKLTGFALLLIAMSLLQTPVAALAACGLAAGAVVFARLPVVLVLRRTGGVALFLSTFFLILPFSHPGGSRAGVQEALVIVLKGTAMVLTIFPMFWTAPLHRSLKALAGLRLPQRLVTLLLLTFRYVQTYEMRLAQLRISLQARWFRFRRNLETLRMIGGVVGLLLLRSFEQTERIYQAMLCRGYGKKGGIAEGFPPVSISDGCRFAFLFLLSLLLVAFDLHLRGGGG